MAKNDRNTSDQDYSDIISDKAPNTKDGNKLFSFSVILLIMGFLILAFIILMFWAFSQVI
jgi:trans-aconitate methyltransferase